MPESKNKEPYPDGLFESDRPLPHVHRYRAAISDPVCKKRFETFCYINAYAGIVIDRNEAERHVREEIRERVVKKYIDGTCQGALKDFLIGRWDWVWDYLEMRGCTIEIEEKAPEI